MHKCVCDVKVLVDEGCICGGGRAEIERERQEKERKEKPVVPQDSPQEVPEVPWPQYPYYFGCL